MADESTLEIVYIDVRGRDVGVDNDLRNVTSKAKDTARAEGENIGKALGGGVAQGAANLEATEARIKDLSVAVRSSRSAYIAGATGSDKYQEETKQLKDELLKLSNVEGVSAAARLRANQSAATAERGLATLRGEASRLGIAQQAGIGASNLQIRVLRNYGPAGRAAAAGLELVRRKNTDVATSSTTAATRLQTLRRGAVSAGTALGVTLVASIALGLVALTRFANKAKEVGDRIEKGSQQTGLSIESYQELAFVFDQNGVSADKFELAVGTLNARIGEAASGNASYKKSFDDLGISVFDANGKVRDTEGVLLEAIDRINGFESSAERAAAAGDLFGERAGRQLAPLLNQGVEATEALRQKARELGLVISGEAVVSLTQYKDELAQVQGQFQTVGVEITAAFLPILRDGLIPLIQAGLIPLLQQGASELTTLTTRFFDSGEEGEVFRGTIAAMTADAANLGATILGLGQLTVGTVQIMLAPVAAIGAQLGNFTAQLEASAAAGRALLRGDFAEVKAQSDLIKLLRADAPDVIGEAFFAQAQTGLATLQSSFNNLGFNAQALEANLTETLDTVAANASSRVGADFTPLGASAGEALGKGVKEGAAAELKSLDEEIADVFANIEAKGVAAQARANALGNTLDVTSASIAARISLYSSGLDKLLELGAGENQINFVANRLLELQREQARLEQLSRIGQKPSEQTTSQSFAAGEREARRNVDDLLAAGRSAALANRTDQAVAEASAANEAAGRAFLNSVRKSIANNLVPAAEGLASSVLDTVAEGFERRDQLQRQLEREDARLASQAQEINKRAKERAAAQETQGLEQQLAAEDRRLTQQARTIELRQQETQALRAFNESQEGFATLLDSLGRGGASSFLQAGGLSDEQFSSARAAGVLTGFGDVVQEDFSEAGNKIKESQDAAAQTQQQAANEFAKTIVQSAGQAGGVLNSILSGNATAGSVLSGLGGAASGIVSAINPLAGAIVGVGSSFLGGAIDAIFGRSEDESKQKAAAASRQQRSVPSVSNSLEFNITQTFEGVPNDPAVRAAGLQMAEENRQVLQNRILPALERLNRAAGLAT